MKSASQPHRFLGIDSHGQATVLETRGNQYGHVILRGGKTPNFDSVNVSLTEQALDAAGLPKRIMVDCSHANAHKDHTRQPLVARNVLDQLKNGNESIIGIMLESNLFAGNQSLGDPKDLKHGVSITDACIDWDTTESLLTEMHDALATK